MKRFSLFARSLIIFAVAIVCLAFVYRSALSPVREDSVDAFVDRRIGHVRCSGACENTELLDGEDENAVLYRGKDAAQAECLPVMLWAGRIREGQIGVNGYVRVGGEEVGIRPITVGDEALSGASGIPVVVSVPASDAGDDLRAEFSIFLLDSQEENMIDAGRVLIKHGEGFIVKTPSIHGDETIFEGCADNFVRKNVYVVNYGLSALSTHGEEDRSVQLTRFTSTEVDGVRVQVHEVDREDLARREVIDVTLGDEDVSFTLELIPVL